MFNFGTKVIKRKEVNALDAQMVVTMLANPEMKGARKFAFSQLAYTSLGFHKNISEAGVPPVFSNEQISFGNTTNALGEVEAFSFFVNNNMDMKSVNVGKTTQGFNDSNIYNKLVKLYDLSTAQDNVFDITRSTTDAEVEATHGIEIYNIALRVESNIVEESTQEVTIEDIAIEDIVLNTNSDVDVTLD
tara:strand:+ start:10018 stop:10584 length:567 start_codon:yes stop_codon:yes gene_type:complete